MFLSSAIFLCSLSISFGDIVSEFQRNEVIPDVIDTVSLEEIQVMYENENVTLAEELKPFQVRDVPVINFTHDESTFYTLIMIDPDAPIRKAPIMRELNLWLVVNIPGDDLSRSETLVEYIGAAPPQGSGLHRYVFLIYRQPGKLKFNEKHLKITDQTLRERFSCRKFADKYKLGAPVGGFMFQAQWDDYVLILNRKLTGRLV